MADGMSAMKSQKCIPLNALSINGAQHQCAGTAWPPTTWTTFPAGGGGLERGRMLARLGLRLG
jgi:hypothetical protein